MSNSIGCCWWKWVAGFPAPPLLPLKAMSMKLSSQKNTTHIQHSQFLTCFFVVAQKGKPLHRDDESADRPRLAAPTQHLQVLRISFYFLTKNIPHFCTADYTLFEQSGSTYQLTLVWILVWWYFDMTNIFDLVQHVVENPLVEKEFLRNKYGGPWDFELISQVHWDRGESWCHHWARENQILNKNFPLLPEISWHSDQLLGNIPYCCDKNHDEFFHTRMLCSAWWGRTRKSQELAHRKCDHIKKQDPVSTMQKTGITNYSSFMIWSGLEKGITYECDY